MKLLSRNAQHAHIGIEQLSAYLDNQVTAAERTRTETHLRDCATCQAELHSLRQTVTLLRALPRVRAPRAFTLSEAQVGIRRPADRPAWLGGMVRWVGAVTAIVLVAVVAATVLRPRSAAPSQTIARVVTVAPAAPGLDAETPRTLTVEKAQPENAAPAENRSAQEAASAPAATAAMAEQAPTPAAEQPAEAPALAPAPETEAMPKAVAPALVPAPATAAPAVEKELMALAPAPAVTSEVTAMGLHGGAGETAALPPAAPTPEPLPPAAAASAILPAGAGMVYADGQGVWAIDRDAGTRQLAPAPGATLPIISPNREWVAYRVPVQDYWELWAIRWSGQDAHLLLAGRGLPKEDLGKDYSERRIHDVRWTPGKDALAVTTIALPAASNVLPKFELWNLDAGSGALVHVLDLVSADLPIYAPDGARFALLQYGTERNPEGSLSLFNADGTGGQVALKFAAGPNTPRYDSQLSWLPDSSGFWIALPDALTGQAQPAGVTLYRVPVTGKARTVRHIAAADTHWAPNGSRLVYTRAADGSPESRELYLADADGGNPQLYATLRFGMFINWAPDTAHFLYQGDGQVCLGAAGEAPVKLGNAVSVFDPRWITPAQLLHLHDQDTGWMLVSRTLDGKAFSLAALPRDITYDVVGR